MGDNNSSLDIIKIAYSDDMEKRNLDVEVQCNSEEEFLECVDFIGQYNDFNPEVVRKILKLLEKMFEEEEGRKAVFDYRIAREGSPAFYVRMNGSSKGTGYYAELLQRVYEPLGYIADLIVPVHVTGDGSSRWLRFWYD